MASYRALVDLSIRKGEGSEEFDDFPAGSVIAAERFVRTDWLLEQGLIEPTDAEPSAPAAPEPSASSPRVTEAAPAEDVAPVADAQPEPEAPAAEPQAEPEQASEPAGEAAPADGAGQ